MDVGFTRRNIGRLVLLAWAVALAWLARRQFSEPDSAATAGRTTRLAPAAQYYAVYAGSRQIGQLNLAVDTLIDGVRLTELFVLDLPSGDTTQQQARGSEYTLSRSLRLRHFTRTVFGMGPRERLDGDLGADSILRLQNAEGQAGAALRRPLRVAPEAFLPIMLPYRAAFGGQLRVGGSFRAPLLDLGATNTRSVLVRVTAESTFIMPDSAAWDSLGGTWVAATADTVTTWRLEHDAPGAPTVTWVDATGAVVRQETAGGLTLVQSAFEIVRNNYRTVRLADRSGWRRRVPGVYPLTGSRARLDTIARERWFLRQPDSGATVPGVPRELAGGRQSVRGDTVIVLREAPADSDAASVRAAREVLGASWQTPLEAEIGPLAARLLKGALSRRDSAARLTAWVAQQIATDPGDSASVTAAGALSARRAGADGKARLLASLARASMIPARVVTGLAVLPEGSFAHSWVEMWVDGWVAADPTYGQFPASASLVRLAVGERSNAVDLLQLTASARFLPIRRAP